MAHSPSPSSQGPQSPTLIHFSSSDDEHNPSLPTLSNNTNTKINSEIEIKRSREALTTLMAMIESINAMFEKLVGLLGVDEVVLDRRARVEDGEEDEDGGNDGSLL